MQLTAALLPVTSLPDGYSEDAETDDSSTKTFCDYRPPVTVNVQVRQDFEKGSGVSASLLSAQIRQYTSPAAARSAFSALSSTMRTCRHDTDDGTALTYAVVNMATVGEASIQIRIDYDGGTAFNGFALIGAAVVSVGSGGVAGSDSELIPTLLRKQVERYRAAAQR